MSAAVDQLRSFWDRRYEADEFVYGEAPNDFLVQYVACLRPGGKVLCVADGEGRNGVWLACQGFTVTTVDISTCGLTKARSLASRHGVAIETVSADVSTFDLGVERWDAIVSIFLHLPKVLRRDLHHRAIAALRPGGMMLFEAYGPQQLGRGTGGPVEPTLLPALTEIDEDFHGCDWLHRFEGLRELSEGRLHDGLGYVVQAVVRKRW